MAYSLVLLEHWLVSLAVLAELVVVAVLVPHSAASYGPCRVFLTALVEEELSEVEIFLLACSEIELSKTHLCNLVSWNYTCLSWLVTNFAYYAVCVLHSDVEERLLACSLVVSNSSLAEVAEVVELMAEVFHHLPTLCSCPSVWMLRVLSACSEEVAVWLLSRSDDSDY